MPPLSVVNTHTYYEIQCYLHHEARLFDNEEQREWLDELVDPEIRYQVLVTQERSRDGRGSGSDTVYVYDDGKDELDFRVKQFETGMQWMTNPVPKLRHLITNIEGFQCESDNEFRVYSNGMIYRSRKVYEENIFVFSRDDILRRGDDNKLRLLRREVLLDQRLVRSKNMLFFI